MNPRMPCCASTTVSPGASCSSQPSSYDMPEQPPPTRRIRSPHSGLPSSRRSSLIFFAAVSVIVTIIRNLRIHACVLGCVPLAQSYHRIPPAGRRVSASRLAPGGSAAISTAARATSSGRSIRARAGAPGIASQRGVSTAPATSRPTRTPSPRSSSASTRLHAATPALVAAYAAAPAMGRSAATEPTFRIVPRRWRSMTGSTARQHTSTARRFSASIASQSAGLAPATGPNDAVPAAVTSTSRRPSSATASPASASTAASCVPSVGIASARPPRARMCAATPARCWRERAASTTAAPSAANASATARPIPRPAPVTSAPCPSHDSYHEPPARLDQLHELRARLRPVAEGPEHRRGHRLRVLLLHPAHQHAEVDRLHHDRDAAGLERLVERRRDLRREPLLHLQAPAEHLDEPRDLRQPHDLPPRHVRDVRLADEWEKMMLTEAEKVDVLHDHHLVVVLDEEGIVQDVLHVPVVSRRQVAERLRDALRRLREPLAVGILAQLLQELGDQPGDHRAPPSYSKRFLAVSTTPTRRSAPAGTSGASSRQNAPARPSPAGITPASSGTASSVWWSTREVTARSTAASSAARSTAMPVTGSGRPATVTST